jgi:hypothetical protein
MTCVSSPPEAELRHRNDEDGKCALVMTEGVLAFIQAGAAFTEETSVAVTLWLTHWLSLRMRTSFPEPRLETTTTRMKVESCALALVWWIGGWMYGRLRSVRSVDTLVVAIMAIPRFYQLLADMQ